MVNIPTDLLRTLVSVIDFRSHTKAAQYLGMTQPAVSTQIKRLQELLGTDLFDKSAPGIRLTTKGEIIAAHARRILSLNDKLLHLAAPSPSVETLRIGIPNEFLHPILASVFVDLRVRLPQLRVQVRSDMSDNLLSALEKREIDVALALTAETPRPHVRHYWSEGLTWARSEMTKLNTVDPVGLVIFGDGCIYGQAAMAALGQAGREYEVIVASSSVACLSTAVQVGFGVMPVARRIIPQELFAWDDAPLPKLPNVVCGVYVQSDETHAGIHRIADSIAETTRS